GRARSVPPTRARTGIARCLPTSRGDLDDRPRPRQAHRMLDLARGPNEHLIGQSGSRHELGTPALVLDLDILDANIASLAAHAAAHGYAVRAVAKIHKTVEIAKRQVGAGGDCVCCATLREAEVMADARIP